MPGLPDAFGMFLGSTGREHLRASTGILTICVWSYLDDRGYVEFLKLRKSEPVRGEYVAWRTIDTAMNPWREAVHALKCANDVNRGGVVETCRAVARAEPDWLELWQSLERVLATGAKGWRSGVHKFNEHAPGFLIEVASPDGYEAIYLSEGPHNSQQDRRALAGLQQIMREVHEAYEAPPSPPGKK